MSALLLKASLDGDGGTLYHQSASVRLDPQMMGNGTVCFNLDKLAPAKTSLPVRVVPFEFQGLSVTSSIVFLHLDVYIAGHSHARRWGVVQLCMQDLEFSDSNAWFKGSLRDVRKTCAREPPKKTIQKSIFDGATTIEVVYQATRRFDAKGSGAESGILRLKNVTLRLACPSTLERLFTTQGDRLVLKIGDRVLGRANRISETYKLRTYWWSPLETLDPTEPPLSHTQLIMRHSKRFKKPFTDRPSARLSQQLTDDFPDAPGYSNFDRQLPYQIAPGTRGLSVSLYNMRYDPLRTATLAIPISDLRNAIPPPQSISPRRSGRIRMSLSPRRPKVNSARRGIYVRTIARDVELVLAVDTSGTDLTISEVRVVTQCSPAEKALQLAPIFK